MFKTPFSSEWDFYCTNVIEFSWTCVFSGSSFEVRLSKVRKCPILLCAATLQCDPPLRSRWAVTLYYSLHCRLKGRAQHFFSWPAEEKKKRNMGTEWWWLHLCDWRSPAHTSVPCAALSLIQLTCQGSIDPGLHESCRTDTRCTACASFHLSPAVSAEAVCCLFGRIPPESQAIKPYRKEVLWNWGGFADSFFFFFSQLLLFSGQVWGCTDKDSSFAELSFSRFLLPPLSRNTTEDWCQSAYS